MRFTANICQAPEEEQWFKVNICKSLSDCSWKFSSCEIFLGCIIETDQKEKLEGGIEEKEGYHSMIKIATEKQELPC